MKKTPLGPLVAQTLKAIEQVSGQGAVYHGLYESTLLTNKKVCAFCRHALNHPIASTLCRISSCNASVQGMALGEPYFYRCWANLLFVTIPVAPRNQCCGGISLGGFCSADERDDLRDTIAQVVGAWPQTPVDSFLTRLDSIHTIAPSALRGLGLLALETTFSSGLNSSEFFRTQNEKYLQQRQIAEAIVDIRKQEISPPDLIGDTYQLVSFLNRDDKSGAMAFTSKYLAKLLMASNWDLAKLKAHVRVLLAVMTSQDILRGTPWAVATSWELRHMLRLEQARTTEESCYEVADWIQRHSQSEDPTILDERSLPERTLGWLQSHYQESITLSKASRAMGTSSSTLIHRLRRETGKTFKQMLTEIRISEAKKLLATSFMGISEVASQCGYFDQSHFTREFKRAINLTPGEFRKMMYASLAKEM